MLINITNSTCIITDPTYVTTIISPMTAEGSGVISPYSNCLPFGIDYGYIGDVNSLLTVGGLNPGGFNQSIFEMENDFLMFRFSPADTMRIFINETGNFTQLLRLGWLNEFASNQSWSNKTSAKLLDYNKLQINFTTPDGNLIYNISMGDKSSIISLNFIWEDINTTYNSTHYPSWYPEAYLNISHPGYTWPEVVRYFDTMFPTGGNETYFANQSVGFSTMEIWDSTKERTNYTLAVSGAIGALFNITEPFDSTSHKWQVIHMEYPHVDIVNYSLGYAFTLVPDQTQTCIGAGTFNMTCAFVPVREGNHTVDMYMEYYYVNKSDESSDTEYLTKSDWFWVNSEPAPGCDTGPTCDIACNWLLGHTCDCNEECASGYCSGGVCSNPPTPPYLPPAPAEEQVPSITFSLPENITLYVNETHQFRVDVQNNGTATLHNIILDYIPTPYEVRISPTRYALILPGQNRSFLISVTAYEPINETVEFILLSDETDEQRKAVDFYTIPMPPTVNVTYINSQLNETRQLVMETVEVISLLDELGYDITPLRELVDSISERLADATKMLDRGMYDDAIDSIREVRTDFEELYVMMANVGLREPLPFMTCVYSQTTSFLFLMCIFSILAFRTRRVMILSSFAIGMILLATYFIQAIQRFSLTCYSFGAFVGIAVSVTLYYPLYMMKPKVRKPVAEGKSLFMFTFIYFIMLTGLTLSLIYTKNVVSDEAISPLSIFQEFAPTGIEEVSIIFTRALTGEGVYSHTIPPETVFTMSLSLPGTNGTLTDYFPKAFTVIDAGDGNVSEYNTLYNRIIFPSQPGIYTLRSDGEGEFYFGKAQIGSYQEYDVYLVHVTSTKGWLPLFAIDSSYTDVTNFLTVSDNNSTTLYEGDYIDIFQWAGEIPTGSVMTSATLYLELDSTAGILHINGTELVPLSPDIYSVPVDSIDSLRITQASGSCSVDHLYLNVTYLPPPDIEIISSVVPARAEIGDLMLLSATLENTGESPANNTIFHVYDEIYSCGDIPPTCQASLSFELQTVPIPLSVTWDTGSTQDTQEIILFSMADHVSAEAPDIVLPGETFIYELTISNDWDKMYDVVVRLNSLYTPVCRTGTNQGGDYCFVQTLHKGNNKISFTVTVNSTALDGDMTLSANITYTNPNGNRHQLDNVAKATTQIRGNYPTSISRELTKISGGGMQVTPHKVPPSTVFNMTLIVDAVGSPSGTLTDYYPNDFALVNNAGGTAILHNSTHHKITWQTTASANISYTLQSPSQWPSFYYFGPASFNEISENKPYHITVADPVETSATVWSGSNAQAGTNSDLTINSGADADDEFDDAFADCGTDWLDENWYFVIDDTGFPSDYDFHFANLTMRHNQTGHDDDDFHIACNLNNNGPTSGTWINLMNYSSGSSPPTSTTNSTSNLTADCGLDTMAELDKLRIKIYSDAKGSGEDAVTWWVDYLNVTVWYTAYGIPDFTRFRIYESSSPTIGSGTLVCDISNPESGGACSGITVSTTYRVEIKINNTGQDTLTLDTINHTLMDDFVDSMGSCGYADGSSGSLTCSLSGDNVTIDVNGAVSQSEGAEYWFYYIFTTKLTLSDLSGSYITVYDDVKTPPINRTSGKINMTVPVNLWCGAGSSGTCPESTGSCEETCNYPTCECVVDTSQTIPTNYTYNFKSIYIENGISISVDTSALGGGWVVPPYGGHSDHVPYGGSGGAGGDGAYLGGPGGIFAGGGGGGSGTSSDGRDGGNYSGGGGMAGMSGMSGGGPGGHGGGNIIIDCSDYINISGTLNVNGSNGQIGVVSTAGGGGGGGHSELRATAVNISGTINVIGGTAEESAVGGGGGGGGGGFINISATQLYYTGTLNASGGPGGSPNGYDGEDGIVAWLIVTPQSPSDGATGQDTSVDLTFFANSSTNATFACNFTLDGSMVHENNTVYNSTLTTYSASELSGGTHYWNVTCWNNTYVETISATWEFDVESNPGITWEDPTPDDGAHTTNNSIYLNTTITDDTDTSAFFDWNYSLADYFAMDWYSSEGIHDNSTHGNFAEFKGDDFGEDNITDAVYGKGLTFHGDDDYLNCTIDGLFPTNRATFEVWINSRNFTSGGAAQEIYQIESWGHYMDINSGGWLRAGFYIGSQGEQTGNVKLDLNKWYHVAAVYNGTSVMLYLNGTKVLENTDIDYPNGYLYDPSSGSRPGMYIGRLRASDTYYFNGTIDEFRIHRRALSPEEINASYNNGLYRLFNNFTSLSDGLYNYTAYAIDTDGNLNVTDVRNFTLNYAPAVTWEDPTPDDGETVTNNWVTLNTTITDASDTSAFFDWNYSLVGYWSFEHYNDTGVFDNSTYGKFGIFSGNLDMDNITDGEYGDALEYAGNSESIQLLGKPPHLQIETGDLSITTWVRAETGVGTGKTIMEYGAGADAQAGYWFWYYVPNDDLRLYLGNGVSRIYPNSDDNLNLDDESWHFVAVTANRSGDAIFYMDGINVGSFDITSFQGQNLSTDENCRIGDDSSGWTWNGTLDEVRVYRRVLSHEEINASYKNSQYRLFNNFTSLEDETYNYTAYAIDATGNLTITDVRSVTVGAPPEIGWEDPTPDDGGATKNNWAYLNTTITDASDTSAFFDWNYSLVGYYSMDYYNDTGVFDNSSYDRFGTFYGSMETSNFTNSYFGEGLEFDGDDDYLNLTENFPDFSGTQSFTAMAWVKRNMGGGAQVISRYNSGFEAEWSLGVSGDGNVTLYREVAPGNILGKINVTRGVWHHIAGMYNGTHTIIYVNGVFDVATATGSSASASNTPVIIGGRLNSGAPDNLFRGTIDEVRVFDRALSAEEINASYNNGLYRLEANFTSLSDGTYNYTAYAIDANGNLRITDEREVAVDTIKPVIVWEDPTPDDGDLTSHNWVYLNTTITDDTDTSAFFDWNYTLVGYWAMDWYNSTGVYDNSTYENSGVFTGADFGEDDIIDAKFGRGISFDGTDDYINCGNDSSLDMATNDFTVELWAKTDNYKTEAGLVSKGLYWTGGPGYTITHISNPWRVYFRLYNGTDGDAIASGVITSYDWTHFVGVKRGDKMEFWENGRKLDEKTAPINSFSSINNFTIGKGPQANFDGEIDEVRIYRRALSAEEINASYNNGLYRLKGNITGLSLGTYNYTAYAIDATGNLNISDERNVTVGMCPVVDGNPNSCVDEWVTPDYWLIDDPDNDAGSDTDDIDDVWSQNNDTHLFFMISSTSAQVSTDFRIYFDPDEDGDYDCYAVDSGSGIAMYKGPPGYGTSCGAIDGSYSRDDMSSRYAEYSIDIDQICSAATDCCSSGVDSCSGTTGTTQLYVAAANWWNATWSRRKDITITNGGSTSLSYFPAYLNVSYDSDMRSDYDDLRFFSGSCNSAGEVMLDYEIENYTTLEAHIWIEVPTLSTGMTSLCMYYGNSEAGSGANPIGVWDSNFLAVYHLDDDPTGTVYDSTDNSIDLTHVDMESGDLQDGRIDGGTNFDGDPERLVSSTDVTVESFTVEFWTSVDAWGSWITFVSINDLGDVWRDFASDTTSGIVYDDGTTYTCSPAQSGTEWRHVAVRYDDAGSSDRLRGFINGSITSNTNNPALDSITGKVVLGALNVTIYDGWVDFLNGRLDEVRISDNARTDNWINQTYQLVANQADYVNFGDEEPIGDVAPDATYTTHDFSSGGPENPIPEFPFGAIIAILLPLMIMYIFKGRKR